MLHLEFIQMCDERMLFGSELGVAIASSSFLSCQYLLVSISSRRVRIALAILSSIPACPPSVRRSSALYTKKSCLGRRAKCWSKSDLLRHSWRISEPKFERHLSALSEDKMSIAMPLCSNDNCVAPPPRRSRAMYDAAAAIRWLSLKMMTNDVYVSSFVHAAFVMPLSVGGRRWHWHVSYGNVYCGCILSFVGPNRLFIYHCQWEDE